MSDDHNGVTVTLTQQESYRFELTMDQPEGFCMVVDEGPPLSEGAGPNPSRMLAAAVGHCLGASLLFCLEKSRNPITEGVKVEVKAAIERNENKRLRIGQIEVDIQLPDSVDEETRALVRCESLFEDFCVVTGSVRNGIPVGVSVNGKALE